MGGSLSCASRSKQKGTFDYSVTIHPSDELDTSSLASYPQDYIGDQFSPYQTRTADVDKTVTLVSNGFLLNGVDKHQSEYFNF